jgi:MPBQ/MSBQ methyltransferase
VLRDTGLLEVTWVDVTELSLAWFRERVTATEAGLPPLGVHLLLGTDFQVMFRWNSDNPVPGMG